MADETQKTALPPYIAYRSFSNFIEGLRGTGLPSRIDKSIMGSMSGATQSSLLLALKYLGLTQADGTPTQTLTRLVKATPADTKSIYAELLASSYGFIAAGKINLESATQSQLDEVFREAGLSGDTTRKGVTFYVLMAEAAGMKVSPHIKAAKRSPSTNGSRPRKKTTASEPPFSPPAPASKPVRENHRTYLLDLSEDQSRVIEVTAPTDLKAEEIQRMAGWMQFQFNVGWKPAK